ncbi:MAG TPA: lipoyl(octanoyl) transferase LipB [Candidatus Acidoferrales bacterium]|jgi:lipoyl(octanoyl) transferase|nr:lipoyl(octanoyl) transferase LipB [Candidatus Acidoferrales bacterium]
MKELLVVDLGLVEYGAAWELQRRVAAARKADAIPDVLLLCEHPHVITLGRSGKIANLRAPDELLRRMGVSFFETNRGGDITYHGPGQLVGYPILNLAEIRRDVAWYVRSLEEAMIRATAEFGIATKRVAGRTGVWVDVAACAATEIEVEGMKAVKEVKDEEKLAAIGVHLSRWVTSHGFAYNVSTNLRYFDLIVPCGIANKRATSLEKLLGRRVAVKEAAPRITARLGEIFGVVPRSCGREDFEVTLRTHDDRAALAAV